MMMTSADPVVNADFPAHEQTYRSFVKWVALVAVHAAVILLLLAYFLL
jgi:hypothetical protein